MFARLDDKPHCLVILKKKKNGYLVSKRRRERAREREGERKCCKKNFLRIKKKNPPLAKLPADKLVGGFYFLCFF